MGIAVQWPLVLFTVVAGIGGGILVPAGADLLAGVREGKQAIKAQFVALVVSMVLLVAGGCFSLLHLASPSNVMAAVFNIFSFSGISLELILLGLAFIAALVLAVLVRREAASAAVKVVAALGIVIAALLLFFCGHGYVMLSRPAWDTNLLPLAYLGTSLAGGAFTYGAILAVCKAEADSYRIFKPVALACSIVCAVSCAAYAVVVAGSVGGGFAVLLWGGIVLCGVIGVLATGIASFVKLDEGNALVLVVAGLVLAFVAILAVRLVMWGTSEGFLELFALASNAAPVIP